MKLTLKQLIQKSTCDSDEYCNVKTIIGKKHCSKDYANNCQTAKFYKRYEEYLGIGAMVVVPGEGFKDLRNENG